MDIAYQNLQQFISTVQHETEVKKIIEALEKLSYEQIEELQSEYNVMGHPLMMLARIMLQEYEKHPKA